MKTIITTLFLGLAMSAQATIHTVDVGFERTLQFAPSSMQVSVGDTVRFKYVAGSHNTTSVSMPDGAAPWAAPMTSSSASTFDYVVKIAGAYSYE